MTRQLVVELSAMSQGSFGLVEGAAVSDRRCLTNC